MDTQNYLVVAATLFLSTGVGFVAHQAFSGSEGYVKQTDLRVDSEKEIASMKFDGNFIELRLENTKKAKFYYRFNDTRDVQQIKGLKNDGTLQTLRDIKSFGNKTYFLYMRYMDDASQSKDAYMELYRIEET